MKPTSRNFILIIILMLSVILLPVLSTTSMIDLMEEDEDTFNDDDFLAITTFLAAWSRVPVHQMSFLLRLGISIYALFVVYLGGRSKTKRFNDRIIDSIQSLISNI